MTQQKQKKTQQCKPERKANLNCKISSYTWQYCCLLSYAFTCASVSWTFWQSVQRFQFLIRPGLHFFTASIFTVIHSLQVRNFTVKFKHMMQTRFDSITAMSFWSHVFGPPCTIIRISATTVSNMSHSAATRRTGLSLWDVHKSWTAKVMSSTDKTQIETTQTTCYQSDITTITQHQLHHVRLNISWSDS